VPLMVLISPIPLVKYQNSSISYMHLFFCKTSQRMVFCYFFLLWFLFSNCSRQTGALNRIIDRGSRAINYILSVMVFNVVPTILEVLPCSSVLHIVSVHQISS
jgi:ATP-binding cassette, subfamily B (MDR/TAP), member 7